MEHGRYSVAFQKKVRAGQAQMDRLLRDPELLDIKRTVAASHLALDAMLALAFAEPDPPAAALAQVVNLAGVHARTQALVLRELAATEVISRGVLPALQTWTTHVHRLVDRYVPIERREAFKAELRASVAAAVAEAESSQWIAPQQSLAVRTVE